MLAKSLALFAMFSLATVAACTEVDDGSQNAATCAEADPTQTTVDIDDAQDHILDIIALENSTGAPGEGADAVGCCGAEPAPDPTGSPSPTPTATVSPTPLPFPSPFLAPAPGNTCTDEWGKYSEAAGRYFAKRDAFGVPYVGLINPLNYCAAVKTLLWDVRRAVGAWKDCCAAKGGATVAGCNAYTPGHVFPNNYPR